MLLRSVRLGSKVAVWLASVHCCEHLASARQSILSVGCFLPLFLSLLFFLLLTVPHNHYSPLVTWIRRGPEDFCGKDNE